MPITAEKPTSPVKIGTRRHSTPILFSLCILSFSSANLMLNFFLPIYMKGQGLTDGQIGTVFGLMSISALLLMFPLGVLSDLFPPRRLVFLGVCIFIFYSWQMLTAESYWQFFLVAPLGGLAVSTFFIVLYALFLKVINKNQVGIKIALYQSGMYLGLGIGPAIGGVLIKEGGFGALLWGVLAGGLVVLIITLKLPQTDTIRLDLGGYKRDLRQGRIILFLLLVFTYPIHFGVEQTSLTLLMKDTLDFSFTNIGLVYLMIGVWMAFLAPFAGHRFDTSQSLRALLVCGLAISGIFQILTATVSSLPSMVIVRLLHTVGDVMMILSIGVMTAAFFPEARMGGNSAVVVATRTCGVFTGNLGSGFINGALGYGYSFAISGSVLLLFVILTGGAIGRLLTVNNHSSSSP
ncbi:MAG: MFS transporter [Deltaproteobacteria bacterium]|nr:MFS transporter [Deltaproteobacteria bacterium]